MRAPPRLAALLLATLAIAQAVVADARKPGKTPAAGPEPDGWPQVGGDQGGSRHSTLEQIDQRNVWRLERAWTWRHGDFGRFPERRPFSGFQATPILLPAAAGGSLVLCTPFNRLVALDPATGKERWAFDPQIEVSKAPRRLECLGVTYWQDPAAPAGQHCAHRILEGTSDRRLLAVDAADGKRCTDFGANGQVDMSPLLAAPGPAPGDPWDAQFPAPPAVVNGVLLIGYVNSTKNSSASVRNGAVHAFDARTGALRWSFDLGGAGNLMSVDEQRDLVFVPTSGASRDRVGGNGPGDDRHANAVVALRGKTGAVVWSFQTVHHDVWNWDAPSQPLLVDVPKDGRNVPAVVVVTRQSLVFVLDRATGKPLFPVEERPVPTDGVAGEALSKTQPYPVKPPPLMKTTLTPADAWGLTFWDQNRCRDLIAGARHGDLYTPPGKKDWIMFPAPAGGLDRGSGAWDPQRNLLVTSLAQVGQYLKLVPPAIEHRPLLGPTGMPCTGPPWSTLVGVDLAAGEVRWSVPLGTVDRLAMVPVPALNWGAPVTGGPTVTAGGLTFIGSTDDARLRAFDSDTGAELWSTPLPAAATASPMTYERDGRQFVVIAAGGLPQGSASTSDDYLVAYALPRKYLETAR